jgi:hypothetical protein
LLDIGGDAGALIIEGHDNGEAGRAHGCLRPQRTTPTKSTSMRQIRLPPNM